MYPIDSKVRSVKQLQDMCTDGSKIIHVAVTRDSFSCSYQHHYLIIGDESVWENYLTIVHYSGGLWIFLTGSTAGKVQENRLPISEVEKDICNGMYVITRPNYPKMAADFYKACVRAAQRLGERAYSVVYNNCEHFINYIMTGFPKSEQIMQSCLMKKVLAETVDMTVNDGKINFLVAAVERVLNTKFTRRSILEVVEKTFAASTNATAIKEMIENTKPVEGTSYIAKKIIYYIVKNFGTKYSAEEMLCSETVCNVAETANIALKGVAKLTGVLSFATEAIKAAWKIFKLWGMKRENMVQDRDFKREMTKELVIVIGSTIGTVAGSVLGLAFGPAPFCGYFLLGYVWKITSRWVSSIATGIIFDWWWQ